MKSNEKKAERSDDWEVVHEYRSDVLGTNVEVRVDRSDFDALRWLSDLALEAEVLPDGGARLVVNLFLDGGELAHLGEVVVGQRRDAQTEEVAR